MFEAFARGITDDAPMPVPLSDSLMNMKTMDAVSRSAKTGSWENVDQQPVLKICFQL